MATLTISQTSTDTTSRTLTYNATDAQRIFQGWQNAMKLPNGTPSVPSATHQDFINYLGDQLILIMNQWVDQNETVVQKPTPPTITG